MGYRTHFRIVRAGEKDVYNPNGLSYSRRTVARRFVYPSFFETSSYLILGLRILYVSAAASDSHNIWDRFGTDLAYGRVRPLWRVWPGLPYR